MYGTLYNKQTRMTDWPATYKKWDVEYREKFKDQHTLPTCETQLDKEACESYAQGGDMKCQWSIDQLKCSIKADEIISQIAARSPSCVLP